LFHNALSCTLGDSSDSSRELSTLEDDVLELTLVLKLRVFGSTWRAKYTFELSLVSSGGRIDILEAKLRAQESELNKIKVLEVKLLRQESILNELQAGAKDRLKLKADPESSIAEFTSSQTVEDSDTLRWVGGGPGLVETSSKGVLTVQRSGVYLIGAAVTGLVTDEDSDSDDDSDGDDEYEYTCLLKNGDCIQVDYFVDECSLSSSMVITRLKPGDELSVTSTLELEGSSMLFIQRLGN
jgi:hypothetical protein